MWLNGTVRTLRYFFLFNALALIVAICGILVAKVVLLKLASSQVSKATLELERNRFARTVHTHCQALGAFDSGTDQYTVVTQHVRFTSDTEYVQEGVCPGFSLAPIELGTFELPAFTSKVAGSSGIVTGQDAESGIELQVFAREVERVAQFVPPTITAALSDIFVGKKSVVLSNGKIVSGIPVEFLATAGPQSTCSGFGYSCCDVISELGVGQTYARATDCPNNCYSQCDALPVILSFNTSPTLSLRDRSVSIAKNETVTFSYVLDVPDGDQLLGTLDYGDGTSTPVLDAEATVSHMYSCPTTRCTYTAQLTVATVDGKLAPQGSINSATIVVQ